MLTLVIGVLSAMPTTTAWPAVMAMGQAPTRHILTPNDFRYVGRTRVNTSGAGDVHWGQGFTHRYVGNELRILTLGFKGNVAVYPQYRLCEFRMPSDLTAQATLVQKWENIWPGFEGRGNNGVWTGLWWDEGKQRLWTFSATDYTIHKETEPSIFVRTLNDDGTISNFNGPWTLKGIGATRTYGGACKLPSWFCNKYALPSYAVGWGGYTSLMGQGFPASLGPCAYAIPDPESFAPGLIPTAAIKTLMDHSSGSTTTDWYKQGLPTTGDRSVRNGDVVNYYDGGDNRPNGRQPGGNGPVPTNPPLPGAQWLSPAPDGLGRWVWGDSNWNTGCWIETPTAYGFITVPSLCSGKAWYSVSALANERATFEIQVFDPDRMGEVAKGLRQPWAVKPAYRWQIALPGRGGGRTGPWGCATGASYDDRTGRLYIYSTGAPFGSDCWVYVWQVGPGGQSPAAQDPPVQASAADEPPALSKEATPPGKKKTERFPKGKPLNKKPRD